LTLTISEVGCGFDPVAVRDVHYGLRGLGERAEMLGAILQVTSVLQAGTTVQLLVPNEEDYDSRFDL
jgi:signal transduction histidine kinase